MVWTGAGNSYKDGITKNLWKTKLSAANSPWNYPLQFGHPIVDRPLKGEKGEGMGINHIIGNTLPSFRFGFSNTVTYKKFSLYALLDGTIGHKIQNQGEGWGLLDLSSAYFDQGGKSVERGQAARVRLARGWIGRRRFGRVLRPARPEQLQHRGRLVRQVPRSQPHVQPRHAAGPG